MALRILVNREQEELDSLLEIAPTLIRNGGRLVVISFMSSEDRKVKEKFRSLSKEGVGGIRATILTKRPIEPSEEEVRRNPPSRSAKLRAVEILGAGTLEQEQ
jgi:16S rRNA (cytosine1402-N4)-methyltransferase